MSFTEIIAIHRLYIIYMVETNVWYKRYDYCIQARSINNPPYMATNLRSTIVTTRDKLEHFYQCWLHNRRKILWSDFILKIEVLKQACVTSIESILLKTQRGLAGLGRICLQDERPAPVQYCAVIRNLHQTRWHWVTQKEIKIDQLKKLLSTFHIDYRVRSVSRSSDDLTTHSTLRQRLLRE